MSEETNAVELATELTVAWLANPNTRCDDVSATSFLNLMFTTVDELKRPPAPVSNASLHLPAVSVRKSLANPNFIVSMIDGKPYRALRRHLTTHNLTPEEYRKRYKLRADYPMVAPAYSEQRRAMAHKLGLGRKPVQPPVSPTRSSEKSDSGQPRQSRGKRQGAPGRPR